MNSPAEPAAVTEAQKSAARLTAWAVNALEPVEQTEFSAALAADPALQSEADATRDFCRLLEESLASPALESLQLPPAARETLEAAARRPSVSRLSLWMPSLAAAACFTVLIGAYAQLRQPAAPLESAPGQKDEVARLLQTGMGHYDLGLFDQAEQFFSKALALDPANATARKQLAQTETQKSNYLRAARDHTRVQMLAEVDQLWETPSPLKGMKGPVAAPPAQPGAIRNYGDTNLDLAAVQPVTTSSPATEGTELLTEYSTALPQLATSPGTVMEEEKLSRFRQIRGGLTPAPAREPMSWEYRAPTNVNFSTAGRDLASATTSAGGIRLTESLKTLSSEAKTTAESYRALPENPFRPVLEQPLSTFSIDVDTASYAIVRRHLNEGRRPPPEAVRLEELINYFPMDDAPPTEGKPFAVRVETASAPWAAEHRLVRVALKGKAMESTERPAANLVFLVDTSGSMNQPNKLPLVQQSLQLLLSQLQPRDHVALVTYAGESRIALPSTPVSERAVISAAIDALSSGGSTNGSGGITAAYETARAHFLPGGVNRVLLATDGDFNVGLTSEGDLESLITREAKSGVYLSVLAYGSDNLKDTTAELLADKGNGNYAYIDSLSEARRALAAQLQGTLVTIAKDVKIQVEFNPAQVSQYRLLGYENRALANKDFNDDTKDAGEIGAGHSVTALYEIVPTGTATPVTTTTDPLRYQTAPPAIAPSPGNLTPAADTGELLTVKLRWQQPEGTAPSQLLEIPVKDPGTAWPQAGPNFRWTAAVAGYGLLLRESTHAGNLTWDAVRQLAAGAKGPDPDGFRGEFLQLVEKATGLVPRP